MSCTAFYVVIFAGTLAGCANFRGFSMEEPWPWGTPAWVRCSRACSPVGFTVARGGCVCLDGGWSECACAVAPKECAADGGPAPKEWRLW